MYWPLSVLVKYQNVSKQLEKLASSHSMIMYQGTICDLHHPDFSPHHGPGDFAWQLSMDRTVCGTRCLLSWYLWRLCVSKNNMRIVEINMRVYKFIILYFSNTFTSPEKFAVGFCWQPPKPGSATSAPTPFSLGLPIKCRTCAKKNAGPWGTCRLFCIFLPYGKVHRKWFKHFRAAKKEWDSIRNSRKMAPYHKQQRDLHCCAPLCWSEQRPSGTKYWEKVPPSRFYHVGWPRDRNDNSPAAALCSCSYTLPQAKFYLTCSDNHSDEQITLTLH